jgi:hypothetical protein
MHQTKDGITAKKNGFPVKPVLLLFSLPFQPSESGVSFDRFVGLPDAETDALPFWIDA